MTICVEVSEEKDQGHDEKAESSHSRTGCPGDTAITARIAARAILLDRLLAKAPCSL